MIIHGKEDYHIGYYEDCTLPLIHALASHANIIMIIIIMSQKKNVDISSRECHGFCPSFFCFFNFISTLQLNTDIQI